MAIGFPAIERADGNDDTARLCRPRPKHARRSGRKHSSIGSECAALSLLGGQAREEGRRSRVNGLRGYAGGANGEQTRRDVFEWLGESFLLGGDR
jgi:hypothetical protein